MSKTDYVIIGGGIIGMMTARELAIQGANVAIFDRQKLGMEASWVAGGILSSMKPWAESDESMILSNQGKSLYPQLADLLKEETQVDPEYIQSGLVIIDKDHATKTSNWARNKNIELVDNVEHSMPNINLPDHSVLLPEIAQIRPPRLLQALRHSLESLSVSIHEQHEVTNLGIKNNQFHFVEIGGEKMTADSIIITAGVWSRAIIENIGVDLDVKPIRGQMVCVKPDEKIMDKIILDGAHYFIPRQDGHVLIGSTMEDVGFVNETTKIARKELLDWAVSVCPDISKAKPVSQWSGLRPSTSMGKPIIGKMPGIKNVYLNTGQFRKGILQAPSSAKLLVDSLSGENSFMDIEKFKLGIPKKLLESV